MVMVWEADSAMGGILLHLVVRWGDFPGWRGRRSHDTRPERAVTGGPQPIQAHAEHRHEDAERHRVELVGLQSAEAGGGGADADDDLHGERSRTWPASPRRGAVRPVSR